MIAVLSIGSGVVLGDVQRDVSDVRSAVQGGGTQASS